MKLNKSWRMVISCALTAALAVPALAAAPRYQKKQATIKVKQTELTKELKAKDKGKKPAGPSQEVTADDFLLAEEKVGDIRKEMIKKYEMLIEATDENDAPEAKADYMFRLAEIYAQMRRLNHFKAMEIEMKLPSVKSASESQKLQGQEKNYLTEEQNWLKLAVKEYTLVEHNPKFKAYKRMDSVLFFLAYMLTQAKMDEEARTVFKRLIKDYQDSKYIPDAYLAFAEYFFSKQDFDGALSFYTKVLQFKSSGVYGYAKYKTAWVYYNLGDPTKALGQLIDTVEEMKDKPKTKTLVRAARKDIVRVYAEIGQQEKAYPLFKKVGGDQAFDMLAQLGELYLNSGKFPETIKTYHELMKLDPKNKDLCNWQFTVFKAQLALPGDDKRVAELERLVQTYIAAKGGKIPLPKASLEECRDTAENTASELARLWHTEAIDEQGTVRLPERLPWVNKLYKIYLDNFPDADDAAEMRLYAAELAWTRAEKEPSPAQQRQLFMEAGDIYTAIAKTKGAKQDVVKEAAYSAMQAYKNGLGVDDTALPPPPTGSAKKYDEKPIPDNLTKLSTSFDLYLSVVKPSETDQDYVFMKFKKAQIFYDYFHFKDAIPIFQDIIEHHRKSIFGVPSAYNFLFSLEHTTPSRVEEIPAWVDKMLQMSELTKDQGLQKYLEDLKEKSLRLSAEKMEKDQDYRGCGLKYIDILKNYPQSTDIATLLYNAAACFDHANLLGAAIKMRLNLVKVAPNDPLAQKSRQLLGSNYARVGYFDSAAGYFEEFAKKYGGEKEAMQSLGDATFFRRGLGQDDKAVANGQFFIKQYGKKNKAEGAKVFYSLAAVYEKHRKWDDLVKHLTAYIRDWGSAGGVDRLIVAHVKIADVKLRESCPIGGVNGACVEIKQAKAEMKRADTGTKKRKKKRAELPKVCAADRAKTTVISRKDGPLKEAMDHYKKALALFKGGKAVDAIPGKDEDEKKGRVGPMLFYAARAQFVIGEMEYEKFLDVKIPALDFRPEKTEASKKKFFDWIKAKNVAKDKALNSYKAVLSIKGAGASHWAIAAAARVGMMFQNIADSLYSADIPKVPSDLANNHDLAESFVYGYCDGLAELVKQQGLDDAAVTNLAACLKESTDRSWFNEWSKLCEEQLSNIKPQDFPPAVEERASPVFLPETSDYTKIITDLAGSRQ